MTETPYPLYLPPHEHLLKADEQLSSVPDFVKSYFFCAVDPAYPFRIRDELRIRHRSDNSFIPPELVLLKRLWLSAAEYGFPDIGEHQKRMQRDFQRPITDPFHILAALIYLAKRNVALGEKKFEIIDKFKLKENERLEIWNYFVRSQSEQEEFQINYPPTPPQYSFTRKEKNLPLLVPDLNFQRGLAVLNLSFSDADKITVNDFRSEYFPQVKKALENVCNIEKIVN